MVGYFGIIKSSRPKGLGVGFLVGLSRLKKKIYTYAHKSMRLLANARLARLGLKPKANI